MLYHKRFGFTLAEVLITLGIIGIVAALTLPVLISSYKKSQTISKLKVAYALISDAFKLAVVDYGDMKTWDYVDELSVPDSKKAFIDKYLIPYVKGAEPSSESAYNATGLGYPQWPSSNYPHQPDGNILGLSNRDYYPINLLNGIFYYAGYDVDSGLMLVVDLNNFNKPNMFGYDIFIFSLVPEDNTVKMYGYKYPYKDSDNSYRFCKQSRAHGCGLVIEKNGWDIPDDYPIRF